MRLLKLLFFVSLFALPLSFVVLEQEVFVQREFPSIANRNFKLNQDVFFVYDKVLERYMLEEPGAYGVPSKEAFLTRKAELETDQRRIYGLVDKDTSFQIHQLIKRSQLLKEDQYLALGSFHGQPVVLNPVIDSLILEQSKIEKWLCQHPNKQALLNF